MPLSIIFYISYFINFKKKLENIIFDLCIGFQCILSMRKTDEEGKIHE
jgi:hypothetical protein